jgi:stage III sporulation protein SpoIIIAA
MPEVIVIDEIGTEAEAAPRSRSAVCSSSRRRGHSLENLVSNPTLADLAGGVHAVLGDEEARERRRRSSNEGSRPPSTP